MSSGYSSRSLFASSTAQASCPALTSKAGESSGGGAAAGRISTPVACSWRESWLKSIRWVVHTDAVTVTNLNKQVVVSHRFEQIGLPSHWRAERARSRQHP